MSTQNQTVCFVAARSGGHLLPALTIAQNYKKNNGNAMVLFFSTDTTLESRIVQSSGFVDVYYPLRIDTTPTRLYKIPLFAWHLMSAWITSMRILYKNRPSAVVTTGGYIAIPVCLAAWVLRIPVELWELNAIPGRATRFLASCASKIHVCFASCARFFKQQKKVVVSLYPIRFSLPVLSKENACTQLRLDARKKTVVILGGSQGSVYLNNLIRQWITVGGEHVSQIQIVHQTGAIDTTDWASFYTSKGISAYVCDYTDNVEPFYAAADVILCRAGAGTLFEIAFFNKRALVIPLETETTDHQVDNAAAISYQYPELFTVLRQSDIQKDPSWLHSLLDRVLCSR